MDGRCYRKCSFEQVGVTPLMGRAALRSPQLGRVVPQAGTGSSAWVRPLLGEEAPLSQESELIQGPNIDPEPICTQKPPNLEPTSIGRQLLSPGPTSVLRPPWP